MRSGEPFISTENVRAALEALLYTSAEKAPGPLQHLWLVDHYLANPNLPRIQHSRDFALSAILTALIFDELRTQRHNLGLQPFHPDMSAKHLLAALAADGAASPELIGWDWLYCRYVRVDLNISQRVFCSALHLDERTLRRYQQHAYKRVTEKLIQAERAARADERKRRLLGELPAYNRRPFIARDNLLDHLQFVLQSSPHVLLTGAAGVGKTALAHALLCRQIETDAFEQLIWIGQPETTALSRHQIYEATISKLESGRYRLQDYLRLYRVAVVLDGIEHLAADELHSLLDELAGAQVILTSRQHVTLPDCAHISVPELNPADAVALFRKWLEINYPHQEDWPDETLWQSVGGNPLAISLMAQNLPLFEPKTLIARSIEQLFAEHYAHLTPAVIRAWFAFALCPPGAVSVDDLLNIWPAQISREAVAELLGKHLLEPAGFTQTACILTNAARHFIIGQNHDAARAVVHELTDSLDATHPPASYLYDILEHILLTGWPEIDTRQRQGWINTIWREGLRRGHYAVWKHLFQARDLFLDTAAQIAYAVCLRRVGEWELSQQVLETAIFQAGRLGAFLDQASASVELAVLLRYRGAYERAVVLLTRAEHSVRRYQDENLLQAIEVEKAQIAVDRGDAHGAQAILSTLPQTRRARFLLAETWLLQGQVEPCRVIARQLVFETADNAGELASAYTLLARADEQAEDWEAAQRHFSSAVTLLETLRDPFALARAQVNLGALMIRSEAWDEARRLFATAEIIQEQLNDRVALEVTRHNLRLLDARAAG